MARRSLLFAPAMRNRNPRDRRCSYVIAVEPAAAPSSALRELANYLSTLGVAGCDVIILDPSPRLQFDLNSRILRWVGRHVAVRREHCAANGSVDFVRAASAFAACDAIIVATEDVRYTAEAIDQMCALLDVHEVVEPQDYLDPLPWWGGIEAGRMLVHRGIEPQPDHGATFGFRKSAVRTLRGLAALESVAGAALDQPRRLAAVGAEVFPASDVFVRREPGAFGEWLSKRPRAAGGDFHLSVKTFFFLSLLPLLVALAFLGGAELAGGYAGVIAFATVGLAIRGRIGAGAVFPLRACFFAPLWVLERSVSVYWTLFRKLRGIEGDTARTMQPDGASGERVASGE